MIFLVSDTHFYHKNIINYCKRPFSSVEEMNNFIIQNWNNTVKKDDIVYHLGDFAIGWDKSFKTKKECYKNLMSKLNGKKYLIRGNHDKETIQFYKDIGFIEVYDYFVLDNNLLIHYPFENKNLKIFEILNNFNYKNYENVFHGHIHNRNTNIKNHINVSIENINYIPYKYTKKLF